MKIEYCGKRARYKIYGGSTAHITYRYKNSLDNAAGKRMEKALLDMRYPIAVAEGSIYVLVSDREDYENFKKVYFQIKREKL